MENSKKDNAKLETEEEISEDELDEKLSDERLRDLQNKREVLISADEVFKELNLKDG